MYWFPHEDSTRNRHVWSEYDLEVLELMLMMEVRMWWYSCSCLGWMLSRKY